MNFIQIAGHLGSDAETRFTASGQKVTTFRVATNSRRGGKDETIWWRVTLWGDRFDKLIPYLKKGSAIIVVGELQKPDIYTDKNGQPQVSLEITAELVRFSPFGRGERANEDRSGDQGHAPAPTPNQPQYAAVLGESPYGQIPAAGFSKGYASGHAKQDEEEEDLPF